MVWMFAGVGLTQRAVGPLGWLGAYNVMNSYRVGSDLLPLLGILGFQWSSWVVQLAVTCNSTVGHDTIWGNRRQIEAAPNWRR